MHRASKVARKQCEWKHGGDTIGRMKTCRSRRNPLDGGGLLMEGTGDTRNQSNATFRYFSIPIAFIRDDKVVGLTPSIDAAPLCP